MTLYSVNLTVYILYTGTRNLPWVAGLGKFERKALRRVRGVASRDALPGKGALSGAVARNLGLHASNGRVEVPSGGYLEKHGERVRRFIIYSK